MKNITLIKQLNDSIGEIDPVKKALLELGDVPSDVGMDDGTTGDFVDGEPADVSVNVDDELQRIADYWKSAGDALSDDELRDAVGNDLEQLEYSPEEVEQYLPQVLQMIGRGFE